jgi:hypothetical protein
VKHQITNGDIRWHEPREGDDAPTAALKVRWNELADLEAAAVEAAAEAQQAIDAAVTERLRRFVEVERIRSERGLIEAAEKALKGYEPT